MPFSSEITGAQAPFLALGMGVAPPLVGYCYDRLGRYEPALLVMVAMMAVTIVLYLVLGPYRYGRDLVALPDRGAPLHEVQKQSLREVREQSQ